MEEEWGPPTEHDVDISERDEPGQRAGLEPGMETSSTSTLARSGLGEGGTEEDGSSMLAIYKEDAAPVDFQVI